MSYRSTSSVPDGWEVPHFYGVPSAASHRGQSRPSSNAVVSYRPASSAQDQSGVPLFYGDPSAASHRAQGRPSLSAERSYHSRSPIQDEWEIPHFYGVPSAASHRGQSRPPSSAVMSYRSASSAQDQSDVPLFYGDPSAASHRAQGRPSFSAERSYHSRSPIQDESEESLFYGDPSATSHRGQGQRGKQEDIVIAVMGMTGSGKSKFIGTLTGDQSIEGHSLQSCTQNVATYRTIYNNQQLVLVDTPGFNDTDRKDTVILQEVATWLSASYSDKKLLSGIIYLHRITDNRMDGTAIRNLRMFQSLCGEKVLPNVVLTTTHWDIADQRLAVEREAELRNKFWKGMTQRGAKIMRFDGSREAASRVVDPMLSLDRVVLKIQTQIEGGMKLSDTDAGQTVSEELSKAQKRFEKEITDLRKDMKKASDEKDIELAQILEQERKNAQQKLQQVTFEQEQFRRTTSDDLRAQVARLQQESNEKEKKLKNYKRAKAIAAGGILFGYPGMALATWATK